MFQKVFTTIALFTLLISAPVFGMDVENKHNTRYPVLAADAQPPSINNNLNNLNNSYIELRDSNFVVIRGPIDEMSINKPLLDLYSYVDGGRGNDVVIYISSPGGSVLSGNLVIQAIKTLEAAGRNVVCVADIAMSMGFAIFQACPTRYYLHSSVLMQHQMSLGTKGPIEHIKTYLQFIEAMKNDMDKMQADKMGLTVEEFNKNTISDWWLYGSEIKKNNAADKEVHVSCSHELLVGIQKNVIETIFGPIRVLYSKCPLIRSPLGIQFGHGFPDDHKNNFMRKFGVGMVYRDDTNNNDNTNDTNNNDNDGIYQKLMEIWYD